MTADPWGRDDPPRIAVADLPPLPDRLSERGLLAADPPRSPRPEELPEVQAVAAEGWEPLVEAPLYYALPAVWPAEHRCWLPDRLPRLSTSWDGVRLSAALWDDETAAMVAADRAEYARECGLEPPPTGRLWLLRSPWPSLSLDIVLWLLVQQADELGLQHTSQGVTAAAPVLLARSEDEVWDWWAPEPDHPARQWRTLGRTGREATSVLLAGISPAELEHLTTDASGATTAGGPLTEEQALRWVEAVNATGAEAVRRVLGWRALGVPHPPESSMLISEDPAEVADWFRSGFGFAAVEQLLRVGLPVASTWREAGFDPRTTSDLLAADPLLTPDEAAAFGSSGIAEAERIGWVESGFGAAEARAWTDAGVLPNEARVWRSVGLGAADVHARIEPPVLPPGVAVGWTAFGPSDRASRSYGVVDPPGTRGRIAAESRRR